MVSMCGKTSVSIRGFFFLGLHLAERGPQAVRGGRHDAPDGHKGEIK